MRHRAASVGLLGLLVLASSAVWPGFALGAPVSGPHQTVDNQLTTTQPNAPSGFRYTGRYHAAGNSQGDPPYMRRMASYSPAGLRFDTSVPERCTASDLELTLRGPAACPPGSRLGGGTVEGKFMGSTNTLVVDVFNNTGEQILVVGSPGFATVARGKIHSDGSVEFASPTCYPALSPPGCPTDNALQLGSDISLPPITRSSNGVVRSYLTTPPTCPGSGHWETPIRFWWADGSVDTVVTRQPCTRPPASNRRVGASPGFRVASFRRTNRTISLRLGFRRGAQGSVAMQIRRNGRIAPARHRSLTRRQRGTTVTYTVTVRIGGRWCFRPFFTGRRGWRSVRVPDRCTRV